MILYMFKAQYSIRCLQVMPELFEWTLHTQIYILHTHLYINMCNKEMEIFHFFLSETRYFDGTVLSAHLRIGVT